MRRPNNSTAALAKLPADERKEPQTVVLPGFDGRLGTPDDLVQHLADGMPTSLEIPGQAVFDEAATIVERLAMANGGQVSRGHRGGRELAAAPRSRGARRCTIRSSTPGRARLMSDGPDRKPGTQWDLGMVMDLPQAPAAAKPSWRDRCHPAEPWLSRHQRELGIPVATADLTTDAAGFKRTAFCGGQTRLHGAAYFRFFTWLMLGTAVAFVPYALLYRPKTYLQD